jgi:hypothetical protein
MDLAGEEEKSAKQEEEEDGSGKIGVVHYVLVYSGEGVEYC